MTSLGYSIWRNEQTELNRYTRQAGFDILLHVSELQRIIYLAHFDRDQNAGNPRKVWTEVLILKDMARLMPEPILAKAGSIALKDTI